MTTSVDLLVVGAGPTGLTAAVAAGPSRSVRVVEATSRIGGMAGSVTVAGIRADLGSHRLHATASPAVEALLQRLLGADLQVRPRNGRFRMAGTWLRFPPRPADLARRLPASFVLGAARDLAAGPVRRARSIDPRDDSATFADVVGARLGPTMLDWFYGPYAEKLWGRTADQLAGELARRRIASTSGPALLAGAARTVRPTPPTFRYPAHGYGQLVERLAEEAERLGVTIDLGCPVAAVTPTPDGARVDLADGRSIDAGRVFWTGPPDALDRLLGHPDRSPPRRAMACVYLAFPVERVSPYDAHYLPGSESVATRISEPKNYRDGPDPSDVTVLCAEVPCDLGDAIWTASDTDLVERIRDEIAAIGLTTLRPFDVHVQSV